MSSEPPSTPLEVQCPVCKSGLSTDEYKKALQELQRTLLSNHKQKHRVEKQESRTKIVELKVLQKKQVRSVIAQEKNRRKALRKRHMHELQQIKRKYQVQLEQVRTFCTDQSTKLQGELKAEYNNTISELMKRYEELASDATRRLGMIHTSIAGLEKDLKTPPQVIQTLPAGEVEEQQGSITTGGTEDAEEKRLEIERLKKIQEIGEIIKEIAEQQQRT